MEPPLENHNQLLVVFNEARKRFRALAFAIIGGSVALYFTSPELLRLLQKHLNQQLAFFTVAEPFLAHAKLAFIASLLLLAPWILYALWSTLAKPFSLPAVTVRWFVFFTTILFYAGAIFCYEITLPFGIKFLLGFKSEQLQPVISIGTFVSFVSLFVLAFGFIFELPIFMIFVARVGLVSRKAFEKNRRYAVLIISIVAALLTPTPDVVNMLLMGGPLYLLYEAGIVGLHILKIP